MGLIAPGDTLTRADLLIYGNAERAVVEVAHRLAADEAPRSLDSIRGIALSVQVLAQASGPLLSGILRDWSGNYTASLSCFAVLSLLSVIAAAAARPP